MALDIDKMVGMISRRIAKLRRLEHRDRRKYDRSGELGVVRQGKRARSSASFNQTTSLCVRNGKPGKTSQV
jgi:hypothetical protein